MAAERFMIKLYIWAIIPRLRCNESIASYKKATKTRSFLAFLIELEYFITG